MTSAAKDKKEFRVPEGVIEIINSTKDGGWVSARAVANKAGISFPSLTQRAGASNFKKEQLLEHLEWLRPCYTSEKDPRTLKMVESIRSALSYSTEQDTSNTDTEVMCSPRGLYSAAEMAKSFGVSLSTIKRRVQHNHTPDRVIGCTKLYSQEVFDAVAETIAHPRGSSMSAADVDVSNKKGKDPFSMAEESRSKLDHPPFGELLEVYNSLLSDISKWPKNKVRIVMPDVCKALGI